MGGNMKKYIGITALACLFLFGCSDTGSQAEEASASQKISFKELKQKQDQVLNSYGTVDVQKGVYRIPIARAMELTAEKGK